MKPLLDFGAHSQTRDGRNSWCRECTNAQSSAHRRKKLAENPAYRAALAEAKRAARRAADPSLIERDRKRAEARAKPRRLHDSHVRARQAWLGRCDSHVAAWRAAQPAPAERPLREAAYERAKTAWRRARRLGRVAPWAALRETVPVYEEAIRYERMTGMPWHVDHRVPLRGERVSGLHCLANLEPLPQVLNQAKSNQ